MGETQREKNKRGLRRSCLHPGPKGPGFHGKKKEDNSSLSDWDILIVVDDGASEAVLNPGRLWRICRDADLVADVVAERVSDLRASEDVPTTIAYRVKREGIQIG
jgi:hypothetical protein